MTNILALDLGTHTGVARGVAGCPAPDLQITTWHMPSGGADDVGPYMAHFMTLLKAEIVGVELLVFEAPYIALGKGANKFRPNVIRRLYGMPAVCEGFAHAREIACAEANISQLKKAFAGHGKAEKEEMILAANRRGFRVKNEHEADAAAVWWFAVCKAHPEVQQLYDPVFRKFMPKAGAS